MNHPTSAVFIRYAEQIVHELARKGLGRASGLPAMPIFCEGSLADSAIFPVYPEIAQRHGIPAFGSYAFKPSGSRRNPLDLQRFLSREYEALRGVEFTVLQSTPIGHNVLASFSRLLAA